MPLPLPYAPNIDVDAERLRMARADAARPTPDVGAGVAQAISGGMAMAEALKAGLKKDTAEAFQKEYLDKGNEGIKRAYEEAGAPKDFPVSAYLIPAGTSPEKSREMVVLAIKDLTGAREKAKTEGAVSTYGEIMSKGVKQEDGTYRPATQAEIDAAEIAARGAEGIKSVADRGATAAREKEKGKISEKVANIRATATRTAANIRRALSETKDAGVIAAIERENDRKAEIETELDGIDAANMSAAAADRLQARLLRELSGIDTRISGYLTKVTDPSKVPESIRRRDGKGSDTKKDPLGLGF